MLKYIKARFEETPNLTLIRDFLVLPVSIGFGTYYLFSKIKTIFTPLIFYIICSFLIILLIVSIYILRISKEEFIKIEKELLEQRLIDQLEELGFGIKKLDSKDHNYHYEIEMYDHVANVYQNKKQDAVWIKALWKMSDENYNKFQKLDIKLQNKYTQDILFSFLTMNIQFVLEKKNVTVSIDEPIFTDVKITDQLFFDKLAKVFAAIRLLDYKFFIFREKYFSKNDLGNDDFQISDSFK